MTGLIRVRRRVPVRRVVAATDVPACKTDAQVEPLLPGCEALLAPIDRYRKLEDLDVMAVSTEDHEESLAGKADPGMTRTRDTLHQHRRSP